MPKEWIVSFRISDDGFEDQEKQKVRYYTRKEIGRVAKRLNDLPAGVKWYHMSVTEVPTR